MQEKEMLNSLKVTLDNINTVENVEYTVKKKNQYTNKYLLFKNGKFRLENTLLAVCMYVAGILEGLTLKDRDLCNYLKGNIENDAS